MNSLLNKNLTINLGTVIIGVLFVFVIVMGAVYVGSWLIGPLWRDSQPPADNPALVPTSTSPLLPVVITTVTTSPDQPSLTPSGEVNPTETSGGSASPTPTPTETSTATSTATSTPKPTSTGVIPSPDDWAKLLSSSPVDGSYFAPYDTFTKVWTLKNIGTTTWTTDFDLVFISGTRMTSKQVIPLPRNVKPGKSIELSLPLTAPKNPGTYQGFWMLANKHGDTFGIGEDGDQPLRVKITVLNVDPNNSYDFLLNYCQASWWNSQGDAIKCPSEPQQNPGYVYLSTEPYLENGSNDKPVLWVHSDNVLEGIISGRYPAYTVKLGDHFRAKVGCMGGYPNCNVTFKLLYRIGNDPAQGLGSWKEIYGGGITSIDIDLSPLAGQTVQFILRMSCTNNHPDSAQGFWMTPRIIFVEPTPTPTSTFTATPEPTSTTEPEPETP